MDSVLLFGAIALISAFGAGFCLGMISGREKYEPKSAAKKNDAPDNSRDGGNEGKSEQ